jgi:hypothetical protein
MFVSRETSNSESPAGTKKVVPRETAKLVSRGTHSCERRSNVLIVRMQAFELAIHSKDFVSAQRVLGRTSGCDKVGFELVMRLSEKI